MATVTLGSGRQNHVLERSGESDRITDFRSLYFTATLDEAQEVPPNNDIPAIEGSATGALDFARTRFEFLIETDGIDLGGGGAPDDMTDMHIHGAAVGATGPVIFDFRNDAETEIDAGNGNVTGGWDAEEAAALPMTDDNLAALLAGDTYFNIHTNRDTSGFIRGQILRDGGAGDRIDLSELNIGSFESLLAVTRTRGGDAVIRTFLDDEATTLRLDGVPEADLREGHFIFAGAAAENIVGNAGRDDLFGAGGRDAIAGRGGDDRLFGENGADRISGGGGSDTVAGGLGRDLLTGGALADRFLFNLTDETGDTNATADRIVDFAVGLDLMVLSGIDARAGRAGNQAFSFVGEDAFDAAGQCRVTLAGGNTFVELNTRGADGAEAVIRLDGDIAVTEADFLL
jgi:Ca2+-binding RTX toxin-like protein